MSCDWEGNRRSGVALAMRHRLQWFIHLRAQGLSKGDEHPTNTLRSYGTLYIFMAALRSRCGHYIFALWFLSSFLFLA